MNRISSLLLFAMIAILISCSSGVKVTTDMDKDRDFSPYRSYSFLGWQKNSDSLMSQFDKQRIHDAFKSEFQKRNLEYQKSNGDMSVALYLVIDQKTTVTGYTDYYGGGGYGRYHRYGGGWGSGYSTTTYTESDYLVGTLVMDVFDEASGDQIWQGIAAGTITEDARKREKTIPKSIAALMKEFPIAVVSEK